MAPLIWLLNTRATLITGPLAPPLNPELELARLAAGGQEALHAGARLLERERSG